MAVANYVREQMSFAMGDRAAADEVCDGIDTDGNVVLSGRTKTTIRAMFLSKWAGDEFITAIQNGTGLTPAQVDNLGRAIGNRYVATLIRDEKLTKTAAVSDTVTITETKTAVRT
jgi:hypothetical protein